MNFWHHPNISLDNRSYFILKSFSEFYIRTLEQALISFYKPEINDSRMVSYNFTSVDIKEYKNDTQNLIETYQEISMALCINKTFHTQNEACTQLGITISQLEYNRNIAFNYIFSPVANQIWLIISKNREINLTPRPRHSELVPDITGIDYSKLESGHIYLILEDKKTIVAKYKTLREFILYKDISSYKQNYRNKEFLISIPVSTLIDELQGTPDILTLVESLAIKGNINVYLVSALDVTDLRND